MGWPGIPPIPPEIYVGSPLGSHLLGGMPGRILGRIPGMMVGSLRSIVPTRIPGGMDLGPQVGLVGSCLVFLLGGE